MRGRRQKIVSVEYSSGEKLYPLLLNYESTDLNDLSIRCSLALLVMEIKEYLIS